jgi:hypothetical protein
MEKAFKYGSLSKQLLAPEPVKLLLEENLPKQLKEDFVDHEIQNKEYQILTEHLFSFISYSLWLPLFNNLIYYQCE